MTKQYLLQLAAYGNVMVEESGDGEIGTLDEVSIDNLTISIILPDSSYRFSGITKDVIPYLRPMSDIDKVITVEDYNDDRPFIPSEKINEALSHNTDYISQDVIQTYGDIPWADWAEVIDLLNLWQFDYRGWIDQGKAKVLVHES